MALRQVMIDDLDFTEGAETRTFSLDGTAYEIDLNDQNYQAMRRDFARYIDSGRRTKGKQRKTTRTEAPREAPKTAPVGTKEQNDAIREWARRGGMKVASRGRIPQDVVDKFHENHEQPEFSSAS